MTPNDWIERCAARLHQQWPTIDHATLAEVASEIQHNVERQVVEPEHAAIEWLRRGIPNDG